MRNVGLDEAQTGIKIAGRNINNLRYADDTILMTESKEELSPRGTPACRGTFGGRRKAVRDRLALQGGTGDFP